MNDVTNVDVLNEVRRLQDRIDSLEGIVKGVENRILDALSALSSGKDIAEALVKGLDVVSDLNPATKVSKEATSLVSSFFGGSDKK